LDALSRVTKKLRRETRGVADRVLTLERLLKLERLDTLGVLRP